MTDVKEIQHQIAKLNAVLARLGGVEETTTFADFARSYMGDKMLNPELRDSTKRSFRHHVENHLIPGFGHLPLGRINNAAWIAWVTQARAHGKITRFFNARKTLCEILIAAREEGLIERKPKLANPDAPKAVGRVLTDEESLRIIRATLDDQFRLIFYTFWKTGCRPREVLRWEWDMITWNEPGKTWIGIPARISKCDRARPMPINPNVSRRIHAMWKRGNGSKFVFPHRFDLSRPQLSYHGAFRTSLAWSGVKKCVPYDFRRTFITKRAVDGKSLPFVAKCLDTSVTMIERVYCKPDAATMEDIVK